MESQCISFHEIPDVSPFFSCFLEAFDSVAAYYRHPPTGHGVEEAAREARLDADVRGEVAAVLREQNRACGADAATEKSIDRLAAGAAAIVTGQQVGLFSGPAYTIYKAISAVAGARELTQRGIEAVPVFWMATEDHDLAEVNHSVWNTSAGLERYELPLREEDAGKLVGRVQLGGAIEALVEAAERGLRGRFRDEIAAALREAYRSDETYGSAFAKLLARLFRKHGLIFLNPLDRRLHRLAAPVLRKALEKTDALIEALLERSKQLEERGFQAQVNVTREMTLLFREVEGRRQPIHRKNEEFSIGKASFSREEMLAAIEEKPEEFSPNALLRPVMQDALLPTAAYIGGPAEIAYMAQAQVVYEQVLGRMPAILPRASFTVVEPRVAESLSKYDLDIRDLFPGLQHLRGKMEGKALTPGRAKEFDEGETLVRSMLDGYRDPVAKLDPTLLGVVESVKGIMLEQLGKVRGKTSRIESLRTGALARQEEMLMNSLYPNKRLQERILCPLPLLAEQGLDFLSELTRLSPALSLEDTNCAQHRALVLK